LIRAVTFDLWNTLIKDKDYTEQRIKILANSLGRADFRRSYDQIGEAFTAAQQYVHKVWREENYRHVSVGERLNWVLERLSAKLPEGPRQRAIWDFEELAAGDPPVLVEGVGEVLNALSPKYRIGLICDTGLTPGRVLRRILAGYGILGFLGVAIFSDETGCNKPHRTMFEKALTGLRVDAPEAVHVGDMLPTDIAGAKTIGMKAVWLNAGRKANPELLRPDYEIASLPEVVDILNKMK